MMMQLITIQIIDVFCLQSQYNKVVVKQFYGKDTVQARGLMGQTPRSSHSGYDNQQKGVPKCFQIYNDLRETQNI